MTSRRPSPGPSSPRGPRSRRSATTPRMRRSRPPPALSMRPGRRLWDADALTSSERAANLGTVSLLEETLAAARARIPRRRRHPAAAGGGGGEETDRGLRRRPDHGHLRGGGAPRGARDVRHRSGDASGARRRSPDAGGRQSGGCGRLDQAEYCAADADAGTADTILALYRHRGARHPALLGREAASTDGQGQAEHDPRPASKLAAVNGERNSTH